MSYVSTHSSNPQIVRPSGPGDTHQPADLLRVSLRSVRTTKLPEITFEAARDSLFTLSKAGMRNA